MGNTPAMPQSDVPLSEVDVETSGISNYLSELGFRVRSRKSGISQLDKSWPTKNVGGTGSGEPDLLLFTSQRDDAYPVCVWENKATSTGVDVALEEAQGYIEGAHAKLAGRPNLPRIAVGYDGVNLKATYLAPDNRWVVLREDGEPVLDYFPDNERVSRGVRADGNLVEAPDRLDARVLRNVFDQLRTLYRGIPALKSGRRPIDFTVALLTLRLVIEREQWGSWSEQPTLVPDAKTLDQQVAERFRQLAARCMGDSELSDSYGSIFKFTEHDENDAEVAFDFEAVLRTIPTGKNFFARMYVLLDTLPLLHGADIDIFGEVYQAIGDDAVKRAFGEYFTGRHIIAGLVPVFLRRSGVGSFEGSLNGKAIADVACGTGGFLTETLRFVRREYNLPEANASDFAADSFFGYDLSSSNASRARVNMYFAGDGFSVIQGGVDSLDAKATKGPRKKKFDYILTNPPYGKSSEHHLLHEAFLERVIDLLKPGTGWGLVVMPTGTFENPRSSKARLNLLRTSRVTDVISLPKHAFAPYTTQRTAVVIFQKRTQPIAGTTWEEVVSKVGNEKVAFFVVDHDGFANSDKRFPTRRRGLDGRWVHDDFAPWIDGEGARHPGSLFQALIDEVEPPFSTQGRKYARLSINDLVAASRGRGADRGAGVELLPDNYLRHEVKSVPVAEFLERAERINALMKGEIELAGVSIMSEIKSLTASPLDFGAGNAAVQKLEQLCTVNKGNPGLTEAAIYDAFDADGLPVYGGGVGLPTQFVTPSAKTSSGKAVTVFEGPAIVLSVDGSSGAMQVIPEGKFVCNHHAAVLTAKASDANLNLIAQQAEARLKGLASNKTGSATLTLGTIKSLSIELPLDDELGAQVGAAKAELSRLRRLLS